MRLRSIWKFVVKEHFGKHRPPAVKPEDVIGPEDRQMREEFLNRLQRAIEQIDVTTELWSMRPRKH